LGSTFILSSLDFQGSCYLFGVFLKNEKEYFLFNYFLLFITLPCEGKQGCCSYHSGICFTECCDGTPLTPNCKDIYRKPKLQFQRIIVGYVLRVIDGDTIIVYDPDVDKIAKIRLYGVDCPESDQPFGYEATQFTKRCLLNKKVKVRIVTTDVYGRFVGLVEDSEGNKFNYKLVKEGFAWVSSYCNASFCDQWKKWQYDAKDKGVGLWSQPDPVNPSIWRKYK